MKVEQLIKELQKLPKGIEVCIYDFEFAAREADGEEMGSSIGIYSDFDISEMDSAYIPEGGKPFAVIGFKSTVFEYYSELFEPEKY